MRYQLHTLILSGMVGASFLASCASYLESRWFADLTGWHGGGGYVVEVFARDVAARLLVIPLLLAAANICVRLNVKAGRQTCGFWIVSALAYSVTVVCCYSALMFAQSARE